jgi:hypothetical protein
MIAFPGMLIAPAKEAGMKIPENADNFNSEEFPHFKVFCFVQLGRPMPFPTSHWENAKVVASIPQEKIFTITAGELLDMGIQ